MIERALVFVFLIFLGYLLQRKIGDGRELQGLKLVILSIALPATIFVALLSIRFDIQYLFLPIGAIIFNLVMLGLMRLSAPLFQLDQGSGNYRTVMMLFPSLAPGLSCFPFLSEYLGEDGLALGALADVGNKVFVLIILYLLALHWYHSMSSDSNTKSGKLRSLFLSMINEPINMVIIVALVMVAFGWNLETLPGFLGEGISRAALIMTPLVLLFIGLSVRVKWRELKQLFFILTWRSGMAFLLSAILLLMLPELSMPMMLLIIVFPQSSASFWPFAHMTSINQMGNKEVFNTKLAIAFLACSLPFSTLSIISVFSLSAYFTNPFYLFGIAAGMIFMSLIPFLRERLAVRSSNALAQSDAHEAVTANG
jgi:hypothetical protein